MNMNWKSALALGAVIVIAILLAEKFSTSLAAWKMKKAAEAAATPAPPSADA